jgi:hypothetical protein
VAYTYRSKQSPIPFALSFSLPIVPCLFEKAAIVAVICISTVYGKLRFHRTSAKLARFGEAGKVIGNRAGEGWPMTGPEDWCGEWKKNGPTLSSEA